MYLLLIFIGGGLGSLARYGLSLLFPYRDAFPTATFCANLAASFILGLFLGWMSKLDVEGDNQLKWFLATGFCGGFSTFSTFSAETLQLIKAQQWTLAAVYILSSVLLSLVLLGLGFYWGNR